MAVVYKPSGLASSPGSRYAIKALPACYAVCLEVLACAVCRWHLGQQEQSHSGQVFCFKCLVGLVGVMVSTAQEESLDESKKQTRPPKLSGAV